MLLKIPRTRNVQVNAILLIQFPPVFFRKNPLENAFVFTAKRIFLKKESTVFVNIYEKLYIA